MVKTVPSTHGLEIIAVNVDTKPVSKLACHEKVNYFSPTTAAYVPVTASLPKHQWLRLTDPQLLGTIRSVL